MGVGSFRPRAAVPSERRDGRCTNGVLDAQLHCCPLHSPGSSISPDSLETKCIAFLPKLKYFISQTFSTRLDRGGTLGPGRTPREPPQSSRGSRRNKVYVFRLKKSACFSREPGDRGARWVERTVAASLAELL